LEERELQRLLRTALTTGKVMLGARESLKRLQGAKLLVVAKGAPEEIRARALERAQKAKVALYTYEGTPQELGQLLGLPFRVSVLAIRHPGEADLTPLLSSPRA
jgi:large subunit ribosomal protein L30e